MNGKQITMDELKVMAIAARGKVGHVYYHWSASQYFEAVENKEEIEEDYHILFDDLGNMYIDCEDLAEVKAHTYMRNTGAVGMAFIGCLGASGIDNMGEFPVTDAAIESMAMASAVLATNLGIPIAIQHFMTHAEAGDDLDGIYPPYEANGYPNGKYGPDNSCERWDFLVLKEGGDRWSGGKILRGKAIYYQIAGM